MKNLIAALLLGSALISLTAGPAWAQNTDFTYQGRVTVNGTNFSGSGQFKFALVTSTNNNHQATASATVTSGFVTQISVTSGGNGYVIAPAVLISGGGGAGAAGTAVLTGGVVTGVTVNNAGSGYTSTPTVTIAPPPADIAYTTYWSNDGTSANGSEPATAVGVAVANGLFTVVLGDTTLSNMTALDGSVFSLPNLQLRIWFNDGVNGSMALSPVQNLTPAPYAVVAQSAGGLPGLSVQANSVGAPNVIGGASVNFVKSGVFGATIAGGGSSVLQNTNSVTDDYGTVGGGAQNTSSYAATVGGGVGNAASGNEATVGGGDQNIASGSDSTIAGGLGNIASGGTSAVGGGYQNTAAGVWSVVSGGYRNLAQGHGSVVAGGGYDGSIYWGNVASGGGSFVGSGVANTAPGYNSVASGGRDNHATNDYATVPGGAFNTAGGQFSFAAGFQAKALHPGAFVWADSQNAAFSSTANDQFLVRATGGARFVGGGNWDVNNTEGDFRIGTDQYRLKIGVATAGGGAGDVWVRAQGGTGRVFLKTPGGLTIYSNEGQSTGASLAAGSGSWSTLSDRNAKDHFAEVDSREVLAKVATLPVRTWNYKAQDPAVRHIGPTAQDFHAAFNLGENETSISTVDEGGIALAAIQGLNQKLEAELKAKDARIAELEARLGKLESRIEPGQNDH